MLVFVETALNEAEIPEMWENEGDKRCSVSELKKIYFAWALDRFRGKKFSNKSIHKAISVSRDGLGEWKTNTKSREQAISIKLLDVFLTNGQFWKEEADKNRDPNVEKVVYLRQPCTINGNEYTAILTIKVYKHDNYHKYYHHYLDGVTLES